MTLFFVVTAYLWSEERLGDVDPTKNDYLKVLQVKVKEVSTTYNDNSNLKTINIKYFP